MRYTLEIAEHHAEDTRLFARLQRAVTNTGGAVILQVREPGGTWQWICKINATGLVEARGLTRALDGSNTAPEWSRA